MNQPAQRICSFDNNGTVFDGGSAIFRQVDAHYISRAREIFSKFQELSLVNLGVVPTTLYASKEYMFEHEKYTISYPYEWPAAMLRDAAIYHLDLFDHLELNGLTLKDGLPNNVVFDGIKPKFVDFLSIVEYDKLKDEAWLVKRIREGETPHTAVLRQMFIPHFFIPLATMNLGLLDLGRIMLRKHSCNVSSETPYKLKIQWKNLSRRKQVRHFLTRLRIRQALRSHPQSARRMLRNALSKMQFGDRSGYANYYSAKNEEFPLDDQTDWKPKQISVGAALDALAPETVLDLGANTGWFSRLAESKGAKVISVDIDEASLLRLYQIAKRDQLKITPLNIPFGDLYAEGIVEHIQKTGDVYFTAPIKRLRSDVVMALGLIHHLVLGENRPIEAVMSTLSELCSKGLILEFISMDDPLVAGNPGYFPNIQHWNPDSYNINLVIEAAKKYFKTCETSPSHPATRQILRLAK